MGFEISCLLVVVVIAIIAINHLPPPSGGLPA